MKEFIKHSIITIVLLAMLLAIGWIVNSKLISKSLKPLQEIHFKTLIIGDSHTQTGLDPSFFKDAHNIAASQESLFYTYYKLKHYLEACKEVDNVIIGVSYNSISERKALDLKGQHQTDLMLERYYRILPQSAREIINEEFKGNPFKLLKHKNGFPLSMDRTVKMLNIGSDKNNFEKGFVKKKGNEIDEKTINESIKRQFVNVKDTLGCSVLMISYIDSIAKLCVGRDINLSVIEMPLLDDYIEKIPKDVFNRFNEVRAQSKLKSFHWIIPESEFEKENFGDGDHLNFSGAAVLSKEISNLIP